MIKDSPKEVSGMDFLLVLMTDINGVIKGRTLYAKHIDHSKEISVNTDSSSIPGMDAVERSDVKTVADMSTLKLISEHISKNLYFSRLTSMPHNVGMALSYHHEAASGSAHSLDPRRILDGYEKRLEGMHMSKDVSGISIKCGAEPEFYTIKTGDHGFDFIESFGSKTKPQRYFDMSPGRDMTEAYRMDVLKALNDSGIVSKQAHHECGPSQHEFTMEPAGMLGTADNVTFHKWITKSVASIYGWYASYIPKIRGNLPGNGMHIHISVWDREGRENLFVSGNEKDHFSEFGRSFLAGVLHYAPAFSLVAAPTVNSYKRLVPHHESPTIAVWDLENRSAMVRKPGYAKGDGTRFELRFPDTSANPYLVLPVVVEAGLQGVKKHMALDEPVGRNVYNLAELDDHELDRMGLKRLPKNLGEAIEEARGCADDIIEKALGKDMYRKLMGMKTKEWDDYSEWCRKNNKAVDTKEVTQWEIDRYLYL